ncbi:MAG: site-specific DNA-methyltransferase, partial [Pseudomonadota bacterium]|nr:site-specific DNA-methyltransferase [Pseudomonadota bacterium]
LKTALDIALVENPAIYQWHATKRQALVEQAWIECGLLMHQTIIWVKSRPVLTRCHYMWQHEPCFYGWVKGKVPMKPPANASTVWQIDSKVEDGASGIHPTQKPVETVRRPIEYHTKPGDLIYEPFSGSGTAIIAAEMTGRRCYAMEMSPAFVDVAVKRWQNFTGKDAIHAETGERFNDRIQVPETPPADAERVAAC